MAALNFFAVPEMLEAVLEGGLSVQELRSARQVCTFWKATIDKSPALQERLCLRVRSTTAPDAPRSFPFHHGNDEHFWTWPNQKWEKYAVVPGVAALFATFSSKRKLPKPGSLLRNTLICVPPVYEMEIYINSAGEEDWTQKVTSTTGLTLGDLYDCYVMAQHEHRLSCFCVNLYQYHEDGFVHSLLGFQATIPWTDRGEALGGRYDDLQTLQWHEDVLRNINWYITTDDEQQFKIMKYTIAKEQADENNQSILTLAASWRTYSENADRKYAFHEALKQRDMHLDWLLKYWIKEELRMGSERVYAREQQEWEVRLVSQPWRGDCLFCYSQELCPGFHQE